ncbi:phosphatidylinositol N-acetylglucosaminyltransferase subunit H isoform 3-T3 [Spinachia spinachia]
MMEDEAFTDINGKAISLECQSHSGLCREFTVSVPKVSIGKVLVYTCCVWLVAYAVFCLTEMSSSYASGRETTTFIEMNKIKDIVINEAIHMVNKGTPASIVWHRIIYYLCVLLKDPSEPEAVSRVVPLFQSSKPRLNCLVKVYKSCQEILSTC